MKQSFSNAITKTYPPKHRVAYYDIAKAVLIICLLYSHSTLATQSMGIYDDAIPQFRRIIPFFNAFYMQSFYIITGLCSSFKGEFSDFLWKNIKTLILPAIYIGIISGLLINLLFYNRFDHSVFNVITQIGNTGLPWFIASMFICRILYYKLAKIGTKSRFVIIAILYFLGLFLNESNIIPNVLYHRHAFLMLPYLAFGQYLKENKDMVEKHLTTFAVCGALLLSIQWLITQVDWSSLWLKSFSIPSHDDSISFGFTNFPLHIVNAVLGTAFILKVSQLIGTCRFLETLGFGSLFVYLSNGLGLRMSISLVYALFTPHSMAACFTAHMLVFLICVLLYFPLVKVVYGSRLLSWMVGK